MKKILMIILTLAIVSSVSYVYGAEVAKGNYPAGPVQKLERGFGNAALGWTEIPKRIVDETNASNPIKGILLGSFQGVCKAFARTSSGLFDMVTFPVKKYDKPCILPDMPAAK